MQELAGLVEQDPAMTAKVLQLVNSAVYGSSRHHASVHQALLYLGTQRLKALAVTAQVFLAGEASARGLNLEAQQRHAANVATLAQQFVADPARAEVVFTAALLHEIGTIVLAVSAPDEMKEVSRLCQATGALPYEVEQDVLGTTHGEAGAYLLALWGLPLEIVEAAHHHHHPERAPTDIVVAVHAADALLQEVAPTPATPRSSRLHVEFLEQTPWAAHLQRWRDLAQDTHPH
jgi:HD-like signal output (HDOD) protein